MKTIDDDEFKKREAKIRKSKASIRINTKGMKELRFGEAVRILRDGKWESGTVL